MKRGPHQQQRQVVVSAQRRDHGVPPPAALQAVLAGAAARRGVHIVSSAFAQEHNTVLATTRSCHSLRNSSR